MLFANDLCLCVPEDITVVQFAADTQLMVTGSKRDVDRLVARMEDALTRVYQWFCHNDMKLNTAKTQMLVLGTPAMLRTLAPVTLNFCTTTITESKEAKNLGVMMDRHLTFVRHVDSVSQKCTGMLIALMHAPCNTEVGPEAYCEGSGYRCCGTVCPCLAHVVRHSYVGYKRFSTFVRESYRADGVAKVCPAL